MPPKPFFAFAGLVLVLPALAVGPAWGQPAPAVPANGRTCFCLQGRSGEALAGCVGEQGPRERRATATCWDEKRRTRTRDVTVDEDWTVVLDGQGFCRPCNPQPHSARDGDRGSQPLPGPPTTLPRKPVPVDPTRPPG
jgi:hypothetical protein